MRRPPRLCLRWKHTLGETMALMNVAIALEVNGLVICSTPGFRHERALLQAKALMLAREMGVKRIPVLDKWRAPKK